MSALLLLQHLCHVFNGSETDIGFTWSYFMITDDKFFQTYTSFDLLWNTKGEILKNVFHEWAMDSY